MDSRAGAVALQEGPPVAVQSRLTVPHSPVQHSSPTVTTPNRRGDLFASCVVEHMICVMWPTRIACRQGR
jgi:hypothetical protein